MSDIVNTLRSLQIKEDDYVTLSYSDGADVWHINESHVEETVAETSTASMLAVVLASGIPVYSEWGSPANFTDIVSQMRCDGALDDYDREGWFEEYLTKVLATTIYDNEYCLEYSTEQYDYKRGRCDISANVRVRAGDLYILDEKHGSPAAADSVVSGFNVSVKTSSGTLTLD